MKKSIISRRVSQELFGTEIPQMVVSGKFRNRISLYLSGDFNSFIHLGTSIILVAVWYLFLFKNLTNDIGKVCSETENHIRIRLGCSRNQKFFFLPFHLVQLQEITNRDLSAIYKTLRNVRSAEADFMFHLILSEQHCEI